MKKYNVRIIPRAFLALALLAVPSLLQAQTGNVTGAITDAGTLAPLEAVQVSIVGRGTGGGTNADGRYLIAGVPVGDVTLRVERLGYVTQTAQVTVSADAAAVADFALESEALLLDEVVVTALGITRAERSLGYSVQGIGGDELNEVRDNNVISQLAGKVAGLVVTPPAVLGGTSKMVLRGIASISGNNEPLIVVDGVPIDNSRRETAANGATRSAVVRGSKRHRLRQHGPGSRSCQHRVCDGASWRERGRALRVRAPPTASWRSSPSRAGAPLAARPSPPAATSSSSRRYAWSSTRTPMAAAPRPMATTGSTEEGAERTTGWTRAGVRPSTAVPSLSGGRTAFRSPGWPSPMNVREYFQTGRNLTTNFAISNATERSNVRFSALRMDATGMAPQNQAERTQLALNAGVQVTDRFDIDGSFQYTQTQGHNRPSPGNGSYSAIHIFNWYQRQVDAKRMERATDEWDESSGVLTPNWNHNYHDNVYWLQFLPEQRRPAQPRARSGYGQLQARRGLAERPGAPGDGLVRAA